MATKCKDRPQLNQRGVIQKPSTTATRNDHNELDLYQSANWEDVATIRFAVRQRRASEIIAVDQVEGVRFVQIETWGSATTRQATDNPSWRLTYTDADGRSHVVNFEPGRIEDDGRWVIIPGVEKVG